MAKAGEDMGHEENKWWAEHRVSTTPPDTGEGPGCLKISIIGAVAVGAILYGVSAGCDSHNGSLDNLPARYEQTSVEVGDHTPDSEVQHHVELSELNLATSIPLSGLVTLAPETVSE